MEEAQLKKVKHTFDRTLEMFKQFEEELQQGFSVYQFKIMANTHKTIKHQIHDIKALVDDLKLTEEERKTQHGNEGHDVGVIAQEVEEVLPEVVTTRENGFKGVKYDKMVVLLIEGMKEQQSQIEELKSEIKKT